MRTPALLTALALAAGCVQHAPTTTTTNSTTTSTTTSASATPAPLELGELKLTEATRDDTLLLHADGSLVGADGVAIGSLDASGQLTIDHAVGARLDPDGTIRGDGGTPLGPVLHPDGTVTLARRTLALDAAGNVTGGSPEAPKLRVTGATTPGLRRTALYVIVAIVALKEAGGGAPATTP
jgi:hypothetical protein